MGIGRRTIMGLTAAPGARPETGSPVDFAAFCRLYEGSGAAMRTAGME